MSRSRVPAWSGILLLLMCLVPAISHAASDKTWSATPADGYWANGNNWVGGVAPVSGDALIFPASSTIHAMTNNLSAGMNIALLTFNGDGYSVIGNSITLTPFFGISCTTNGDLPQTDTIGVPIILGEAININVQGACDLTISGMISGGFGLAKVSGTGVLELSGANTFTGPVVLVAGLTVVNNAHGLGSGDGTSGTGTRVTTGARLKISTPSIANEHFSLDAGAMLYTGMHATLDGPVVLSLGSNDGQIQIGTAGGPLSINGSISGPGGLNKVDTGTLTLNGNGTYTGATTVSAGTLIVNGNFSETSSVTANSGTTLGGSGSISHGVTVLSGGTLSPGQSPGELNTGNLSLNSGSTYTVEINGTTPGTQYDQTNVTGTVSLGGSTLNVSLGFLPPPGGTYTIIRNDGVDAVSGTFAGLLENSLVSIGGVGFHITYHGGDGNDVVLITPGTSVPTLPGGGFVLLAGVLALAVALRLRLRLQTVD